MLSHYFRQKLEFTGALPVPIALHAVGVQMGSPFGLLVRGRGRPLRLLAPRTRALVVAVALTPITFPAQPHLDCYQSRPSTEVAAQRAHVRALGRFWASDSAEATGMVERQERAAIPLVEFARVSLQLQAMRLN